MKCFNRVLLILFLSFSLFQMSALAGSSNLVISQLYLGTGPGNGQPRNSYVELFNLSASTVSLSGWTLQYAQGAGVFQAFPLSGSIAPGQYYLISVTGVSSGNLALPTPDLVINTTLSLGGGKFALVNDTAALSSGCYHAHSRTASVSSVHPRCAVRSRCRGQRKQAKQLPLLGW